MSNPQKINVHHYEILLRRDDFTQEGEKDILDTVYRLLVTLGINGVAISFRDEMPEKEGLFLIFDSLHGPKNFTPAHVALILAGIGVGYVSLNYMVNDLEVAIEDIKKEEEDTEDDVEDNVEDGEKERITVMELVMHMSTVPIHAIRAYLKETFKTLFPLADCEVDSLLKSTDSEKYFHVTTNWLGDVSDNIRILVNRLSRHYVVGIDIIEPKEK
jgi:hypothetical protein